jgi:hypothetical protein
LVLALVLRAGDGGYSIWIEVFCFVLVIGMVIISYVPLFINWNEMEDHTLAIVFQIFATIVNLQFGYLFFSLLYIGVIDVMRQRKMLKILHCMIRSTDLMMQTNMTVFTVGSELTSKCHDVSAARVNAILSITDQHEFSLVSDSTASIIDRPSSVVTVIHPSSIRRVTSVDEEDGTNQQGETGGRSESRYEEEEAKYPPGKSDLSSSNVNDAAVESEFAYADDDNHGRDSLVLGETIAREAAFAITPRIQFNYPENVVAWYD